MESDGWIVERPRRKHRRTRHGRQPLAREHLYHRVDDRMDEQQRPDERHDHRLAGRPLGYHVDMTQAEPFQLSLGGLLSRGKSQFHDDQTMLRPPISSS